LHIRQLNSDQDFQVITPHNFHLYKEIDWQDYKLRKEFDFRCVIKEKGCDLKVEN
jgi:hypothetical protein